MFYVLIAAVPASAVLALLALIRVVDAAERGRYAVVARLQALGAAMLLALLVAAAALASPVT